MNFLFTILAATVLHEIGHILVGSMFKLPTKLGVNLLGIYVGHYCNNAYMHLAILSGGILANLLGILVFLKLHLFSLAIGNVYLILINIIPLPVSDGWQIVKTAYLIIFNKFVLTAY